MFGKHTLTVRHPVVKTGDSSLRQEVCSNHLKGAKGVVWGHYGSKPPLRKKNIYLLTLKIKDFQVFFLVYIPYNVRALRGPPGGGAGNAVALRGR